MAINPTPYPLTPPPLSLPIPPYPPYLPVPYPPYIFLYPPIPYPPYPAQTLRCMFDDLLQKVIVPLKVLCRKL